MRKKTVLVIDDDEMNLQIAKMILERKLPCEVICAAGGVEGIEVLRNRRVNLVLLDVLMPDLDGIETLQQIRDDTTIKDVPVMMLTASGDMENVKHAAELGVEDYIKKPFMPADLIKRVEKKLSEIHTEEILLLGDDADELAAMKQIVEENFPHDVTTAATVDDATKILGAETVTLVIACAGMKFIDGFRLLNFMAADEKFSAVPFAATTADNLLDLLDKLNPPITEDPPPEVEKTLAQIESPAVEGTQPPHVEEIAESVVTRADKKKLAHVVTNFIGYELDLKI